jgi:hypothetical protein
VRGVLQVSGVAWCTEGQPTSYGVLDDSPRARVSFCHIFQFTLRNARNWILGSSLMRSCYYEREDMNEVVVGDGILLIGRVHGDGRVEI